MRRLLTRLRIWRLKRRARRLYLANLRELDDADCGFALRDELSGGRLSRREAEVKRLVAEAMALEEGL